MYSTAQPDVSDIPLDQIDVSDPTLYERDCWQPYFRRLREEAPVHYLADSTNGAFWSVSTHELIRQVGANHEVFSSELGGVAIIERDSHEDLLDLEPFIAMDPPAHEAQRTTVTPSFTAANLANFEPQIRKHAVDILENLPVGETFNWVTQVSMELTVRMLAILFDFPYRDRHKLIHWSDIVTAVPGMTDDEGIDMTRRKADLMECAGVFMQLWQERAAAPPKFDLISMLAHGENTRDMIHNPMLFLGNVVLLIVGGNDTTRNSISGGVVALNQFPDEYRKLRENPGVIPNMASEIIRWQTPAIHMRRTATRDFELGGRKIGENDKVVMWYLSGNRDETLFPDAERLIVDRKNARAHLSFGYGIHRCIGSRLAEMQLRVLWEEIMHRFHRVELAGEVKRKANNFSRGIVEVPVLLHPK